MSKECDICHYWYFKDIGFKYEKYFGNGCRDLMMSEGTDLTYYQKSQDVILYRAKDYYENYKGRLREQQEINTETYLKKKKIKK